MIAQLGLAFEPALAQLLGDEIGGERRRIDRRAQARPQPADGADMILVRVREDDRLDLVGDAVPDRPDPA